MKTLVFSDRWHRLTIYFIYLLFLAHPDLLASNNVIPLAPKSDDTFFNAFKTLAWSDNTPLAKDKNQCETVKPKALGDYSNFDTLIGQRISSLIQAIRDEKISSLLPMFHPRLKITASEIRSVFATWLAVYGKKQAKSVFRLYALKHSEENAEQTPCFSDQLAILPQYGYPYQLGLLIQISGEKALGRLYVTLVPYQNTWYIGAFHSWQWTHADKDYNSWVIEAGQDAAAKKSELAFLKLDIASKLLDGSPHLTYADQVRINDLREETLKRDVLLADLRASLPEKALEEVSSTLPDDGVGLLLRMRLKGEKSSRALFTECGNIQKILLEKKPWVKELKGIFCSFLLPRESLGKDGKLGGMFLKNPQMKE